MAGGNWGRVLVLLRPLRAAGLVLVSDADKGYSLRKEMLPNVWKFLQGYLQLEIDPIA